MVHHVHGISTYRQLLDSGLGQHAIAARVERGEIEHIHYNLYRHPLVPKGPQQTAAIALAAVDGRGTLTGAECLRLLGFTIPYRRNTVDAVLPHGAFAPTMSGIEYRRSSHLDRLTATTRNDLVLAPAGWAFGDLARDISDFALAEVIAKAVGARKVDLEAIEASADSRRRFPGSARLRRVIAALRSDLPFSRTEAKAAKRLRKAGLDIVMQHEVGTSSGLVLAVADLAVIELRLDLEIDGPHHWMPEQAADDRRRDRRLRHEVDWETERFSVYEIDRDEAAFVAEVLRIVERRRAGLADRFAAA